MRPKGSFDEDRIASVLQQLKAGRKITDLSRELGISRATLYVWKAKYDHSGTRECLRCRELEQENGRLKQLIGELYAEIGKPQKLSSRRASGH